MGLRPQIARNSPGIPSSFFPRQPPPVSMGVHSNPPLMAPSVRSAICAATPSGHGHRARVPHVLLSLGDEPEAGTSWAWPQAIARSGRYKEEKPRKLTARNNDSSTSIWSTSTRLPRHEGPATRPSRRINAGYVLVHAPNVAVIIKERGASDAEVLGITRGWILLKAAGDR
jgi:hypothetical protein